MRRVFLLCVILLWLIFPFTAHCQGNDSFVYVKQFAGQANNVGGLVTAAMPTCPSNRTIPCILVIDASLAAWAPGTMPSLCENCYLWDWRNGPPGGGGGGGPTIMHNSSETGINQSLLNFLDSPNDIGELDSGYQAVNFKMASGAVTAETPEAAGMISANARFIYTGSSQNLDDPHVLSSAIAITSWSTTGGVTTFHNSGSNSLSAGQTITTVYSSAWPAAPSPLTAATGYNIFPVLSTGLTSSTFEVSTSLFSAGACASSCGSVYSATYYFPYNAAAQKGMPFDPLRAQTYVMLAGSNIQTLAAASSSFAALAPNTAHVPAYLVIDGLSNDIQGCAGLGYNASEPDVEAQIEEWLQSVWEWARSDGYTIVMTTQPPASYNLGTLGCENAYLVQTAIDQWVRRQGEESIEASGGPGGWDILYDLANEVSDRALMASSSSNNFGPSGADLAARGLVNQLENGNGTSTRSEPIYAKGSSADYPGYTVTIPYPDSSDWWGVDNPSGLYGLLVRVPPNVFGAQPQVWVPDGEISQRAGSASCQMGGGAQNQAWCNDHAYIDATGNIQADTLDSGSGEGCLQANTSGVISNTSQPCNTPANSVTTLNTLTGALEIEDDGTGTMNVTPLGSNIKIGTSILHQTRATIVSVPVAELDVDSCIASSERDYQIRFSHITMASGSSVPLVIQFSSDGGSTWDTASNYYFASNIVQLDGSAASTTTNQNGTGVSASLTAGDSYSSGAIFEMTMTLFDPLSTADAFKMGQFETTFTKGGSGVYSIQGGFRYNNSAAVNAMRLISSGGTFTGQVTCLGLQQ